MTKKQERNKRSQHDFTDPVCGMEVSRDTAAAEAEYGKKTYFFCALVCRERFLEDPEKYVREWNHRR